MKRITRMIVFSGGALYLTSLWNKGFIIKHDWQNFLIATLLVAAICYLIVPLSRIILLPINLLTMGLFTGILYVLLIYGLDQYTGLIHVKEWASPAFAIGPVAVPKMTHGYLQNLLVSSYSLSFIINLLERVI